ncbi:26S protease regulatory subunit [Hortaea werneckii]|nr:26S protease regulatory subunit [Hortaea werneckii]
MASDEEIRTGKISFFFFVSRLILSVAFGCLFFKYGRKAAVELNFIPPRITFSTALKKSFSLATFFLARIANMPASVATARSSAPVELGHRREINSHRISRSTDMLLAWIRRILARPSVSGRENSIFRSIRPGRIRAGSRVEGRLVANMTLMLPRLSKPSSCVMSSSMVRWTSLSPPAPSSKRAPPTASISSKKMMHAFFVRAISKSSRTMRAPSPTYFCTSSEPMTRMKVASVRLATARAQSVLPVPGGLRRGISTTSRSFSICSLHPPTSPYVTSGLSSTVIMVTLGSILGGRGSMICAAGDLERLLFAHALAIGGDIPEMWWRQTRVGLFDANLFVDGGLHLVDHLLEVFKGVGIWGGVVGLEDLDVPTSCSERRNLLLFLLLIIEFLLVFFPVLAGCRRHVGGGCSSVATGEDGARCGSVSRRWVWGSGEWYGGSRDMRQTS